jgi:putative photosynthetic complex assembly protein
MAHIHFEPEPGAQDAMPQIRVPRGPLLGALAVVVVAVTAAVAGRLFGVGATHEGVAGSPGAGAVAVERRVLRFADAPDGGVLVYDAPTNALAVRLAPGGDGFLRGTLRAMTRQRMLARVGAEPPFVLTRWSDGRLTFDDSATATHVSVTSFGPTQVASFEQLLAAPAR